MLQFLPSCLEFFQVQLCPGLHKTQLFDRQRTCDLSQRIDRIHRCIVLVINVEVGAVMRLVRLDEHSDDDAKKTGEFRHGCTIAFRRA